MPIINAWEFTFCAVAVRQSDDRMLIAKRMLREADKNEDGRISKEEFFELMVKTVAPDSLEQYDSRLMKAGEVHRGPM